MPTCLWITWIAGHQFNLCRVSMEKYAVTLLHCLGGSIFQDHIWHSSHLVPGGFYRIVGENRRLHSQPSLGLIVTRPNDCRRPPQEPELPGTGSAGQPFGS